MSPATRINDHGVTVTTKSILDLTKASLAALACLLLVGSAPARADLPIRSSIEPGVWGSCGLTSSGDGTCWGYTDFTGQPPGVGVGASGYPYYYSQVELSSISIDPSNANSCVINVAGDVRCWKNMYANGLQPPAGTNFRSVSAGSDFNCGVTSDWDGICWGSNTYGGTDVPTGLKWLKISAGGGGQACGVTTANVGHCWGRNGNGETNVPPGRRWTDIRAGSGFSCGVTTAGEALCWSSVDVGSLLPTNKTWSVVDPGANGTVCGVTVDGDGYCGGGFQDSGGGGGLISGGGGGGVVISGGGGVVLSGGGGGGVITLGGGSSGSPSYTSAVPAGYKWRTLSAGSSAACGITTTNAAKCWGSSISASIPSGLTWGSPATPDPLPEAVSSAVSFGSTDLSMDRQSAYVQFSLINPYGTVSCKLDDSAWGACPGLVGSRGTYAATVSGLRLGSHTLSVRRTDGDGIVLASGSTSWTIYAPPPDPPIALTPPAGVTSGTVGKGNTLKSSGWLLPDLAPGSAAPVYRWQRCDASGNESTCTDIVGEAGATGAWWGTRNSDIGKRLRVKVTLTNLSNAVTAVYSGLSSVIGSVSVTPPALDYGNGNSHPVVGASVHSSFGKWSGYIAGVSSVGFQWQRCTSTSSPESNCSDIVGPTGQWYKPRAADLGRYLRVKATLTTRGQSNIATSAVSGAVTSRTDGR